jgi:hypothetical protein
VPTLALAPGSGSLYALGNANPAYAPTTDERGLPRPDPGTSDPPDIGAYESQENAFTDNFNRANSGALGPNWQVPPLLPKLVFTYRRRLGAGSFATQSDEAVSLASPKLDINQIAGISLQNATLQAHVDASNAQALAVGMMARLQSNGDGYAAILTNSGLAEIVLFHEASNSFTVLHSQNVGTNIGTMQLVVTGGATPTLALYFNDLVTPLFSIKPSGSNILASAGGVGIFALGPNGTIDNFSVSGS